MKTVISAILLVIVSTCFAQSEDLGLKIYDEKETENVVIYADNDRMYPFSIMIKFELEGLTLAEELPEFIVVPPKQEKFAIATLKKPENASWNLQYGFHFMEGDATAEHDDTYIYQLPFPKGKTYVMSQGYNGVKTHGGKNALDFTMPENAIITAARNGTVVKIKEDSKKGCQSSDCIDDGNFVRILHDDGTMAEYVHLVFNGALVELGDAVEAGTPIGKAGKTGWAYGSHLHFEVFKPYGADNITFPTKFQFTPDNVGYLAEKQKYTAFK